ncbi:MAG: hypothetical protein KBA26_10160 [Candidatus Delongbacteria bacterium]|nr:hypothetical protein [Candidatus Delongbacteria bacterium]
MKKCLDNVRTMPGPASYAAAAMGALDYSGLWKGSVSEFYLLTGLAFHFYVHRHVWPNSFYMYDWNSEHFIMLDRLGIYSEVVNVISSPTLQTYSCLMESMIARIKDSLLDDLPVIVWFPSTYPEFGLIHGWNDHDRVWMVTDHRNSDTDPMLFDNLGRSSVPILYLQFIKSAVEINRDKSVRDALQYGLRIWKRPHQLESGYASGANAYRFLIKALEERDFNSSGLGYLIHLYAGLKSQLPVSLRELSRDHKSYRDLARAADYFDQTVICLKEADRLTGWQDDDSPLNERIKISSETAGGMIEPLKMALEHETKAMKVIEDCL